MEPERIMDWPPLSFHEASPVRRALAGIKTAFEFKNAGDMNRFDFWLSFSLFETNRLSAEHQEQLLEGLARQGLTVVYQPFGLCSRRRTDLRQRLGRGGGFSECARRLSFENTLLVH